MRFTTKFLDSRVNLESEIEKGTKLLTLKERGTKMGSFMEYLKVSGMADVTIKNYVSRIRHFMKGLNPEELTQDKLNDMFAGIFKNASSSTINGYIHAVSAYLRFLNTDIKLPKRVREMHKSEVISEEYFEREIISAVAQIYSANDYFKMKALAYLFFHSDVKVADLENLYREDFDLKNNTLKIRASKGRPERVCSYSTQAKEAIDEYFYHYPEENNAFDITRYNVITKFYRLKYNFPDINLNISLLQRSGKFERRANMKK